jgi:hypothetical protein
MSSSVRAKIAPYFCHAQAKSAIAAHVPALFLRPFLPVSRANIDWPSGFGINPGAFDATTRERELMCASTIDDCKTQVTVGWHIIDGTDYVPHALLLNRAGSSILI